MRERGRGRGTEGVGVGGAVTCRGAGVRGWWVGRFVAEEGMRGRGKEGMTAQAIKAQKMEEMEAAAGVPRGVRGN